MEISDQQKKNVIIVTCVIGIVMIVFAFYTAMSFQSALPATPVLVPDSTRTNENIAKEIANYSSLITVLKTSKEYFFEVAVLKILSPFFSSLLVAILGYIFAKDVVPYIISKVRRQ